MKRPNFLISGAPAYEEEKWNVIQIGQVCYKVRKRTERCNVPLVNQSTGIRSGTQPLAALAADPTRKDQGSGKVNFGVYLIPLGEGRVALRSEVKVLSWK